MPDEPQDTAPEEGAEPTPQVKSKISLKTLILVGLPLVIVQAVAALVVVKKVVQPRLPEQKPAPVEEVKKTESQDDQVDLSECVPVEVQDIIVNPAETKGQRYLSVSVVIYVPEKIAADLTDFEPEVRSAIIETISRHRLDELDDPADRRVLLTEVKDQLNHIIDTYFSKSKKLEGLRIQRILFSKYTLQ
ncbi:MAG: flagellar basal body-associated FliL family protein [Candidatus Glassbacteria bacterium]|nr:flagellar basal body-associated FliL family protein [Candidatus Glassbacteria bacterium]